MSDEIDKSMKIALDYYESNPEAKDEVMRAVHAYYEYEQFHKLVYDPESQTLKEVSILFGESEKEICPPPNAHRFKTSGSPYKQCACIWCGQTREGIRWDWYDSPPHCQKRPKQADMSIKAVIAEEVRRAEKSIDRSLKYIKSHDCEKLTGAELFRLHSEQGIDPEMIQLELKDQGKSIKPEELEEYHRLREGEAEMDRSSTKSKRKVIKVKQ